MDDLKTVWLESERLVLRAIALEDAAEIFQEFTSEITTYTYPRPAAHLQETEQFIRGALRQLHNGTDLTLTVLKRENLEFLGICALHRMNIDTPELGIWIKKSAHGHGYGREAVHRLKTWSDEHLEYEYLSYPVDQDNIPSRKIPESLGGKVARRFQQLNLSGRLLNTIEYRIYPG